MNLSVEAVWHGLQKMQNPNYQSPEDIQKASTPDPKPKIDLKGRDHGDFVVTGLGEPTIGRDGKKKARWICQCKTCGAKELIRGDYIRNNQHKLCDVCFSNRPDMVQMREEKVKELNELAQKCGFDFHFTPDNYRQLTFAARGIETVD